MARHTNASKKFFKKPKHFGCDNKPNCEGSLFMNKHAQKTETSTSDDFFLKLDSEKVSTFSKTPGYLKKDNSFFKHSKTASYSDHKNQFGSLKNTDTETSKTLGRGHHNHISHNKSKKIISKMRGQTYQRSSMRERVLESMTNMYEIHHHRKKLWQTQRTGKCNTTNSVTSVIKEKPFDKKKYRLQKYSKKYRVQQWEDRRKKAILHEYFKTVSNDNKEGLDVEKIYQESEIQNADEQNDNLSVGTTGRHKPSMSGGTDANTVKQIAQVSSCSLQNWCRDQDDCLKGPGMVVLVKIVAVAKEACHCVLISDEGDLYSTMENQDSTPRTNKNLSELDETQISQVLSRGGTPVPDQSDSMTARKPLSLVKNVNLLRQPSAILQLFAGILAGPKAKKKPFKSVQEELKRMKEDKIAKKEEYLKKKAEKEEARKKYKKEKIERYKKLSRRTKKGQPIMSDRIEMLLEKIQNNLKY